MAVPSGGQLLDVQLPDGVGMLFDEQMDGWYFPGIFTPAAGRDGDLTIATRIPATGDPAGGLSCVFDGRMTVDDVNEFIDGYAHEASVKGTMTFGSFEGVQSAKFAIDESASRFNYLRVNPATGEAEMRYHIEFAPPDGRRFTFQGTKYMQKDGGSGVRRHRGNFAGLHHAILPRLRTDVGRQLCGRPGPHT